MKVWLCTCCFPHPHCVTGFLIVRPNKKSFSIEGLFQPCRGALLRVKHSQVNTVSLTPLHVYFPLLNPLNLHQTSPAHNSRRIKKNGNCIQIILHSEPKYRMFLPEPLWSGAHTRQRHNQRQSVNLNLGFYLFKAAGAQHFEDGELKRRESFSNLLSFIPVWFLFPFFKPVCVWKREQVNKKDTCLSGSVVFLCHSQPFILLSSSWGDVAGFILDARSFACWCRMFE